MSTSGYVALVMVVVEVTEEDAEALNEMVDDDGSSVTGSIAWQPAGPDGRVTLYYTIPIDGC